MLLHGCESGDAKITPGFNLPARHVIHTVGPVGEKPDVLESSYRKSLQVAVDNGVRTIAFPCISTGVYAYPQGRAAHVALRTVRTFMDGFETPPFDKVIFCCFLLSDVDLYFKAVAQYFPLEEPAPPERMTSSGLAPGVESRAATSDPE